MNTNTMSKKIEDLTLSEVMNVLAYWSNVLLLCEDLKKKPIFQISRNSETGEVLIYKYDYTDYAAYFDFSELSIMIYNPLDYIDSLKIADYGKTWAFTEEELENANNA